MTNFAKLPMNARQMLDEARRITGIDIVDETAKEPLEVLLNSYNNEGMFSEEGAQEKHHYLMRFLTNRLRMQRDFTAHPEIYDIELQSPVVISAMGRTGSTKMQKVLAATGEFNWIEFWQSMNPSSYAGVPNEDIEPRVSDIQRFIDWFLEKSPQANSGHKMVTHQPEEESYMMMHSLISQTMTGYANAPSYIEWYMTQDHSIQFEYVRDFLKYFIWQGLADPEKPFVLKSAMSIGYEDALTSALPNPKMITTHRNPISVIPSSCKLIEVFRIPYSDAPVDHSGLLPAMAMMTNLCLDFREKRPDVPYMDIDYRELHKDAAAVVEAIFEYANISPGPDAVENVRQWDRDNPRHKDGGFKYTLGEFGLSEEGIDAAFARYIEFVKTRGIDLKH